MAERMRLIVFNWRTYVAIILGPLSGTIDLVEKQPAFVRYVIVAICVGVAIPSVLSALARKSTLKLPERFVLSPEDPRHLVGRAQQINEITLACETHSLVFLYGDSGTGKSALIKAGLVPHFVQPQTTTLPRCLPLLMDASRLSWNGGLRLELTRLLRSLGNVELERIGASVKPESDVFSWLEQLPSHASQKLLVILDQFDDYAEENRERLMPKDRVLKPRELAARNSDWKLFGNLVKKDRLTLMIVCRSDMAMFLEAVRFVEPDAIQLRCIDRQLIAPLLDFATTGGESSPVVHEAAFGWKQLKERLLRDLAMEGGQILPVQLVIALDSLRHFRFLTPREYARNGGLRGLERLHIERHLRDAAAHDRCRTIGQTDLLRGLMLLVSDAGHKTKRISITEFRRAVLNGESTAADIENPLTHLARSHIVRRQSDDTGEYLMLYHDYLIGGLKEASRHANRWLEMLRDRARQLAESTNAYERWRALLSVNAQVQLLWQRWIRRRFRYGEYASFAWLSGIRLLPPALLFVAAMAVGWMNWDLRQLRLAEEAIKHLDDPDRLTLLEGQALMQLAQSSRRARLYAAKMAVSDAVTAQRVISNAPELTHAIVGLDPNGSDSIAVCDEALIPALRARIAEVDVVTAVAAIAVHLNLAPSVFRDLSTNVVGAMLRERSEMRGRYHRCIEWLSPKLHPEDAAEISISLAQDASTVETVAYIREPLRHLAATQSDSNVRATASVLINTLEHVRKIESFLALAHSVTVLNSRLSTEHTDRLGNVILDRIQRGSGEGRLDELVTLIPTAYCTKNPALLRPLALRITSSIEASKGGQPLNNLCRALTFLSPALAPDDLRPAVDTLTSRLAAAVDDNEIVVISGLLKGLIAKASLEDGEPAGKLIFNIMLRATQSQVIYSLASTLRGLEWRPSPEDLRLWAETIVRRLTNSTHELVFTQLSTVLDTAGDALRPHEVGLVADATVVWITNAVDPPSLNRFHQSVRSLGPLMNTVQAATMAASLMRCLSNSRDRAMANASAEAIAIVAPYLLKQDSQVFAEELMAWMMRMPGDVVLNSYALPRLVDGLVSNLPPSVVAPLARRLGEKISSFSEKNTLQPAMLGFTNFMKRAAHGDIAKLLRGIVGRFTNSTDTLNAYTVALAIRTISPNLDVPELQQALRHIMSLMLKTRDVDEWHALARAFAVLRDQVNRTDSVALGKLLDSPWAVRGVRNDMLVALESATHGTFHRDIWRFKEFAVTPLGKRLGIIAKARPYQFAD